VRGFRVCRTFGAGHSHLFNGLFIYCLAAFAPLVLDAADWASVAQKALPSTVRIYALNPKTGQTCESAGIVIAPNGKILTAAHCVDGFPEITVLIGDGLDTAQYDASIIRLEKSGDLALIQAEGINGKAQLPPMEQAKELPQVGEPIAAVGNQIQLMRVMTAGIVSAVGNYLGAKYILFDARIEKGNSGGPLLNEKGELVGLVVEILRTNNANIGKAVALSEIRRFMDDIEPGFLGLGTKRVKTGLSGYGLSEGLEITKEVINTPFETGDILMTLKGYPVNSPKELVEIVRRESPGTKVEATILRNGDFKILQVDVSRCPDEYK